MDNGSNLKDSEIRIERFLLEGRLESVSVVDDDPEGRIDIPYHDRGSKTHGNRVRLGNLVMIRLRENGDVPRSTDGRHSEYNWPRETFDKGKEQIRIHGTTRHTGQRKN